MTLRLYMKSGNIITLERIKSWKVRSDDETITGFEIEEEPDNTFTKVVERVIMASIQLQQIEAITEEK